MSRSPKERLVSLDAFRGLSIAAMILVNNPGSWDSAYPPLLHAEWHGWTPTDLIFPSFLFIMGVSMVYSFGRRLETGNPRDVYLQILRRTLVIFALGILLNLFPTFDFSHLRIAGVLQRIAVVYGVASLIVLNTGVRLQATITAGILLFYWLLMTFVPVPGFGSGVLTPEGNLAAYLDSLLLPGRMWQGAWDPEGILSTVPSIATTLMGVLTGHWVRSGRRRVEIAAWMFVSGWGAIGLSWLWSLWFPINKNLWTSSFALFTAGVSLLIFNLCYWLIDVEGRRCWAYPAVVYGMNPIAVYVASGMAADLLYLVKVSSAGGSIALWTWIYRVVFLSWGTPLNASLAMAMLYVVCWFFLMDILYRRRIFLKV